MRELDVEIALLMQDWNIGTFATSNPDSRTIFVGEMPQDIQEGITILQVPSPNPHQYLDMEYTILDFWSRANHSDRSRALLRSVYEQFHRNYDYTTDNWYISWSRALGAIVDADRDNEGGKLFRLSIQFFCRNLNHVS